MAFAVMLMIAVVAWLFSFHGTAGLIKVNGAFRYALITLGAYCILVVPLLAIFSYRRLPKVKPVSAAWPGGWLLTLSIISLAIPLGISGYLGGYNLYQDGDKAPQLLITERQGAGGIPDIALSFWTSEPSQNSFTWSISGNTQTMKEENPSRKHLFVIKDLIPDKQCWYKINDGIQHYFQTAPGQGKPLHFAVGSDSHYGRGESRDDLSRKMLQQIADPAHRFDYQFFLGDFVEHGYNDSHWQEGLTAFSPYTSLIPIAFAASNHDTLLGGLKLYREYAKPAAVSVKSPPLWQRIDVNNIHFLILDLEWSAEAFTQTQKTWLASIPREDWKIVMSHAFYYSSGINTNGWNWYDNPDTIKELVPLFERYGVNLVFSGHNHYTEWLQKNNVNYSIAGSFGGHPNPPQTYTSPASLWYQSGLYAFVDVTINPESAIITFRDTDYRDMKTFTVDKR
jgi:hypothetical protein